MLADLMTQPVHATDDDVPLEGESAAWSEPADSHTDSHTVTESQAGEPAQGGHPSHAATTSPRWDQDAAPFRLPGMQFTRRKRRGRTSRRMRRRAPSSQTGAHADAATDAMTTWMALPEHRAAPYPSAAEREDLAAAGGITTQQVACWFSNARKRFWKVPALRCRHERVVAHAHARYHHAAADPDRRPRATQARPPDEEGARDSEKESMTRARAGLV